MSNPPKLPFGGEAEVKKPSVPPPADVPLVYVASPLTRATSPKERRAIEFQVDKIVTTTTERTHDDASLYRTHAPVAYSSPWRAKGAMPTEIFKANTALILTKADAMIILALNGGSDGTGQELALANQCSIPILRLSPGEEPISKQITGNSMVMTRQYETPDEMSDAIAEFLTTHSRAILDGPRRRRSKTITYDAVQSDLFDAWWSVKDPTHRDRVAAGAQLNSSYAGHFLTHPLLVASLPHWQLLAIGAGLEVDVSRYFATFTDSLTISQTEALFIAKDEYGWDDEETKLLMGLARQEVSSAGTKRLLLNNPFDWLRLKETLSQ